MLYNNMKIVSFSALTICIFIAIQIKNDCFDNYIKYELKYFWIYSKTGFGLS